MTSDEILARNIGTLGNLTISDGGTLARAMARGGIAWPCQVWLDRKGARISMLAYCKGTQFWVFNGVVAPLKEPKTWMPRFSLQPAHSQV